MFKCFDELGPKSSILYWLLHWLRWQLKFAVWKNELFLTFLLERTFIWAYLLPYALTEMHVFFPPAQSEKKPGPQPLLVGMLVLPEWLGHDISEKCCSQTVIQNKLAVGKTGVSLPCWILQVILYLVAFACMESISSNVIAISFEHNVCNTPGFIHLLAMMCK